MNRVIAPIVPSALSTRVRINLSTTLTENYNGGYHCITVADPWLVLATGPGNLTAVWLYPATTGRFGSRLVHKPNPLPLGGPNADPYLSTISCSRVWLDSSVAISSSAFWVSLLIIAFRYGTVNCKILTLGHRCAFWMYWPPSWPKWTETCTLPHPENKCQWSVNYCWSCIWVIWGAIGCTTSCTKYWPPL